MACRHKFEPSGVEHYEVCGVCGTYHSLSAPPASDIYGKGYWDGVKRSTLIDQNYNVEKHLEHGISKNEFVINLIWTQDRSAVLEIACSPGSLLKRLSEHFETVAGIEVDSTYESDIRELAGPKPILVFDYFPEPDLFAKQSFSLIIGLDIFEHVHEPEEFLSECARLLKPDGQLLLMMPLLHLGVQIPARFFEPIEHVFIYSKFQMEALLGDAGFANLRFDRWAPGHDTITARLK